MKAEVVAASGEEIRSYGSLEIRVTVDSPVSRGGRIHLGVTQSSAHPIFILDQPTTFEIGETTMRCRVSHLPLPHGRFTLWVGVSGGRRRDLLPWHRVTSFQVVGPRLDPPPAGVVRAAPVQVEAAWAIQDS